MNAISHRYNGFRCPRSRKRRTRTFQPPARAAHLGRRNRMSSTTSFICHISDRTVAGSDRPPQRRPRGCGRPVRPGTTTVTRSTRHSGMPRNGPPIRSSGRRAAPRSGPPGARPSTVTMAIPSSPIAPVVSTRPGSLGRRRRNRAQSGGSTVPASSLTSSFSGVSRLSSSRSSGWEVSVCSPSSGAFRFPDSVIPVAYPSAKFSRAAAAAYLAPR